MSEPHKHKDCIIAWANGLEIQFKFSEHSEWLDFKNDALNPHWYDCYEYRIKPEPKPDEIRFLGVDITGKSNGTLGLTVSQKLHNDKCVCTHWLNQLKLTFDGETGKLKAVEIIK